MRDMLQLLSVLDKFTTLTTPQHPHYPLKAMLYNHQSSPLKLVPLSFDSVPTDLHKFVSKYEQCPDKDNLQVFQVSSPQQLLARVEHLKQVKGMLGDRVEKT